MSLPRPSSFSNWTVGNPNFGAVTQEPEAGKKETGFTPGEEPKIQDFNWLFYNSDQWQKYLDSVATDLLGAIGQLGFFQEAPVGVRNGSNLNFSLTKVPSGNVFVFWSGSLKTPVAEFNFNGTLNRVEFTAGNAPNTTDDIQVVYMTNAGTGGGGGGTSRTVNTVSADFTVPPLSRDYILNVDSTSGPVTITLPDAVLSAGFILTVKKIGANNVTVNPSGGQFIDETETTEVLDSANESHDYGATTGNWFNY